MKPNLTVIIPTLSNFSGLKYLLNYFKGENYDVVVVDNGPDPKKEKLINYFNSRVSGLAGLKYLPQEKNLGFAKGVNEGAKYARTKWMLILNDDIEFGDKIINYKSQITNKSQISKLKSQNGISNLKNNPIERLVEYAEENGLWAVTPVLRNPNGEVENVGYRVLPIGRIELAKEILNSKIQDPNKSQISNFKTELDGITAACLLIKTDVFNKLRGFDESFFAYLEDVDFFLRLAKLAQNKPPRFSEGKSYPKPRRLINKKKPFGIAYDIEVLHNHMTTSKTMGNFKARQDMINWWRLYFKHPDRFKLNLAFLMERLRNLSGYVKATLYSLNNK